MPDASKIGEKFRGSNKKYTFVVVRICDSRKLRAEQVCSNECVKEKTNIRIKSRDVKHKLWDITPLVIRQIVTCYSFKLIFQAYLPSFAAIALVSL